MFFGAGAVRSALRGWHHPEVLAASPLAAFVTGTTPSDRGDALRRALLDVLESLGGDLTTLKYQRALTATCTDDRPGTQCGAAARLGVPFSTYRRHLDQGTAEVTARLRRTLGAGESTASGGG
ncbi:hypothetical protein [Streptomyces sp. NPDC002758]